MELNKKDLDGIKMINSAIKLGVKHGKLMGIDETISRLKQITNKDVVIIEKANLDDIARELKEQNK